ncbi:MAG: histidine phosphotransferase [Alphaproteobacteria bacterium]|nr:MAG: histidine phosphotransferase [Alphaproteobacteria bacterium]
MDDIAFSALLCSRLCHDLISPVGALANGLEILGDETDEMMRAEVVKLLVQSAEVTSAKLKFFRLSFGAAGGFGEKVPLSEAEDAIRGLYGAGNINLSWQSNVGAMDRGAMKLMMNMVLVAGESLIRGGKLLVEIREQSPVMDVTVTIHGDKVIFQDVVRRTILGEISGDNIEAKSAPAFLAANIAQKLGSRITYISHNEQSFSLQMTYGD